MNNLRHVIRCDKAGNHLGLADIEEAHRGQGMLHLAFSVYIFRDDTQQLLIQQRSAEKMLWPLAWANSCCSHPRDGDQVVPAATRRLQEECGFTCSLTEVGAFVYRAEDPAGKGVEYEYDTLLVGRIPKEVELHPDAREIADWRWINTSELRLQLDTEPNKFAPWLAPGLQRVLGVINSGRQE